MVRKHISAPKRRFERGIRLWVDDSSSSSQGTIPYQHEPFTPNTISAKSFLYGKQTDVEVHDALGLTTLFGHQDGWLDFWDNLHEITYKKVILEFYTNLSVEENNGNLSIISTVKGVDLFLMKMILLDGLG